MSNEEHASTLNLPELWNTLQGADSNDKGASCLAKLCDGIGKDKDAADMLPEFQKSFMFHERAIRFQTF